MSYCHPDLIVTSNRVPLYDDFPVIALNDFINDTPFLSIYDTDLMSAFVQYTSQAQAPSYFSQEIFEALRPFQEAVFHAIEEGAKGRNVLINPYYNAFTDAFGMKGYDIVGPNDDIAYELSRKTSAFLLAQQAHVPAPEGTILSGKREVVSFYKEHTSKERGIFVASDDDPYHPTNIHITSEQECDQLQEDQKYLATVWQKCRNSQNTQVIIGKNQVFYLGVTDQIIKDDVKYYGNTYPTRSSSVVQNQLKKYTLQMASIMQGQGYRGIAGFDWIETQDGEVLFVEINPRKNRSTAMLIGFLERCRPPDAQSIIELEIAASLDREWDTEEWPVPSDVQWSMEIIKAEEEMIINEDKKPAYSEVNIFSTEQAESILNYPEKGTVVSPANPDIARIINVRKQ